MTVWHKVFGDTFDERRAAPPAYGRRPWSKVVSYLIVFRYGLRFWSEFRRRLKNETVPNYKNVSDNYVGTFGEQLPWLWRSRACRSWPLFEKCFLDRLFQMARRASWNNLICTWKYKYGEKHSSAFIWCLVGIVNNESWVEYKKLSR